MTPDFTFRVKGHTYGFARDWRGNMILLRKDPIAEKHPEFSSNPWYRASLHDCLILTKNVCTPDSFLE